MTQLAQARESSLAHLGDVLCTAKAHTTSGRDVEAGRRTSQEFDDVGA